MRLVIIMLYISNREWARPRQNHIRGEAAAIDNKLERMINTQYPNLSGEKKSSKLE